MPMPPRLLELLAHPGTRAAGGAALGVGAGQGAAHLMGYDDLEGPSTLSSLLHGTAGALLASAKPSFLMKNRWKITPALAAEEALPMYFASQERGQDASRTTADAMRGVSKTVPLLDKPTLSEQLQGLVESPTARGAGGGAALAGLAALLTGATRPPSTSEIQHDRGRPGMILSDFAKYVLPAMLGGGVIGSLQGDGGSPQG